MIAPMIAPRVARSIATAFGIGFLPFAPGTWGSLASIFAAWGIVGAVGQSGLLLASMLVLALGWWAADVYVAASGIEDAPEIVIDEVAGMWLALLFVPHTLWAFALAFLAFRVFDIVKPWPIGLVDRKVGGGLGVMADDVVAAGFALIVVHGILFVGAI